MTPKIKPTSVTYCAEIIEFNLRTAFLAVIFRWVDRVTAFWTQRTNPRRTITNIYISFHYFLGFFFCFTLTENDTVISP